MDLHAKVARLESILDALSPVTVAFSGGVDSTYLLAAAVDRLGATNVVAVTVDSPLMPRAELDTARAMAAQIGAPHVVLPFDELGTPEVAGNPSDRCYHCKRLRFEGLLAYHAEHGERRTLLHGDNADDHLDYRPGARAASELGARAPLAEAGLTKAEIRELSRQRGLPTWDHPAAACLATRFPTGTALTREGLARVEQAEVALQQVLGHGGLRVRDHYPVARVEVPDAEIAALAREPLRGRVVAALRQAGYRYVALDLGGYRMGSMNDEPAPLR